MPTVYQKRVAEQVRTILSEIFLREMRDPRLQGVTVTEVTVDRELQFAEVYVHAAEEQEDSEIMAALNGAAGYLRHELAGVLHTRTVPQLRFRWDPSFAYADHIDQLLEELEIPEYTDDEAGES
jgi:ribosome-binding factor A